MDEHHVSFNYCSPRSTNLENRTNLVSGGEEGKGGRRVPIISLLGGKEVTHDAMGLLFHAIRMGPSSEVFFSFWKAHSVPQLLEAVQRADQSLFNVTNFTKDALLTIIDKLQCEHGFNATIIAGLLLCRMSKDKSPATRGRAREVIQAFMSTSDAEMVDLIDEAENTGCLPGNDGEPCSWNSPGYIRLQYEEKESCVELLRLIVAYAASVENFHSMDEWHRVLETWKKVIWKNQDISEYFYAEDESFARISRMSTNLGLNPPTHVERVIRLIANCRKDVVKSFSDRCRREKWVATKMSLQRVKDELRDVVSEIDMKLPWEVSPSANPGSTRPICDGCGKLGHTLEKCWASKPESQTAKSEGKIIPGSHSNAVKQGSYNIGTPAKAEAPTPASTRKDMICTFCGMSGHTIDYCWKKNGKPPKRSLPMTPAEPQVEPVATNRGMGGYMTRSKTRHVSAHLIEEADGEDAEVDPMEVAVTYMTTKDEDDRVSNALPLFTTEINGVVWKVLIDSCAAVNFMNLQDVPDLNGTTPKLTVPTILQGVHGAKAAYTHSVRFPIAVNGIIKCFIQVLAGPAGLERNTVVLGGSSMCRLGFSMRMDDITFNVPGITLPIISVRDCGVMKAVRKVTIDDLPDLPVVPQIPVCLHLCSEVPRVRTHGYPLPPGQAVIMDQLVDELVEQGILRNCSRLEENMHVSPGFLIEKKTAPNMPKKYRMLVDLRRINSRLVAPAYDIHTVADFVQIGSDSKFFTKFDVKNAFFTREVAEESWRILTMKTSSASETGFRYTQWRRLPQGLNASPMFWCDRMDSLIISYMNWLADVAVLYPSIIFEDSELSTTSLRKVGIRCYIDDGMVFGTDANCVKFVSTTFADCLAKNGHEVHKVSPISDSIDIILGLTLSSKGWRMSDSQCTALKEAISVRPTSIKELQALLGILQYSRTAFASEKADSSLSAICGPLYSKISKTEKFSWTDEDDVILTKLFRAHHNRELCYSADGDIFHAGRDLWCITSDASNTACAGVLYKVKLKDHHVDLLSSEFNDLVCQTGRIVDCWSHRFSPVEQRWLIHEREAYGLIKSIARWQSLVFSTFRLRKMEDGDGLEDFPHLVLLTDNSTTLGKFLKAADGIGDPLNLVKTRKWYAWYSEIEAVLTTIPTVACHISGSGNVLADFLSRKGNVDVFALKTTVKEPTVNLSTLAQDQTGAALRDLATQQLTDRKSKYCGVLLADVLEFLQGGGGSATAVQGKQAKAVKAIAQRFELGPSDNALWFRYPDLTRENLNGLALYVPSSVSDDLRAHAILLSHDNNGHPAFDKSLLSLRRLNLWWPCVINDLKTHIHNCTTCRTSDSAKNSVRMNPVCIPASDRLKFIAIDVVGPLPATPDGIRYILTILERFTGFCIFCPIVGEVTTEKVIEAIYVRWIGVFGRIQGLHSDCASVFVGNVMTGLGKLMGITMTNSPAYYKQGNGQVERCHATLKRILKISNIQGHDDWCLHLPIAQLLLNETPRGESFYSPAELIFGLRTNHYLSFGMSDPGQASDNFAKIKMFSEIYELQRDELKARMIDSNASPDDQISFHVGDLIFWYHEKEPLGKGPYKILDLTPTRAKVSMMGLEQWVHKSQIRHASVGSAPLPTASGRMIEGEFVVFPWEQDPDVILVARIEKIVGTELTCQEYEREGKSGFQPMWVKANGDMVRAPKAPPGSRALKITCKIEDLIVSYSWTLTPKGEVPQKVRRCLREVEF